MLAATGVEMSTWTQVNDRGDVPGSGAIEVSSPAFEGCRVKTTSSQTVNGNANVLWDSDSATGCFDVGGLWSSGDPGVVVVPEATSDNEFWHVAYVVKFAYEDYFAGVSSSLWSDPEATILVGGAGTYITLSGARIWVIRPGDNLAARTLGFGFSNEYVPPFTVEADSWFSVCRCK